MSSENSPREVAPQSDDTNRAPSASPTSLEQNNMEGSYATQVGGDPQQVAASALLQFRTRVNPDLPQEDPNTYTPLENRNTHGINGLSSSENRNTYSRSWTTPYITSAPENMSAQHNPYYYSQATMQSTITGLTSAINNLQQEHLTMNTRQDSITGTLEQVLSALQELKSANASSSQMQSSMGVSSAPICNSNNANANSQRNTNRAGENVSEAQQWQVNDTQSNSNTGWDAPPSQEYYISEDRESYTGANYGETQVGNEERYEIASSRPSTEGSFHQISAARSYQRCDRQNRSNEDQRVTFDRSQDRLFRYDLSDEAEPTSYRGELQTFARRQNDYRPGGGRGQSSAECYGLKIPPFNGKEDWKVWINRFEAIAERRYWNEETKLDNLLPKLQGKAGDFVFTQVTKQTLGNYSELVKELNSRLRVVETEKTYAAKFSQRRQRADKKVEEYAADLKRLYAKAYKNRDSTTKQEDLVRRFLDGMHDSEARFEIEYHKEPIDIDQAVYHAVNFIQTRRRSSYEVSGDRRQRRYARRTSSEYDGISEEETFVEEEQEEEHAYRVPTKQEASQIKKNPRKDLRTEQTTEQSKAQVDSMKVLTETRDLMQELVTQLKSQTKGEFSKKPQQAGTSFGGRGNVQCYACKLRGHFARDCPNRAGDQAGSRNTGSGVVGGQPQGNNRPLN